MNTQGVHFGVDLNVGFFFVKVGDGLIFLVMGVHVRVSTAINSWHSIANFA